MKRTDRCVGRTGPSGTERRLGRMNRGEQKEAGHLLARMAAIAALITCAGCLVIPMDYHAAGSRHNVSFKSPAVLQPGVTTKEEVFLTLGEPDYTSEDGRRLGYAWTKVKAVWVVAGYGNAAGGEIKRSYVLETTFDDQNRVSGVTFLKAWGSDVAIPHEPDKDAPL